jgi:hypothetical protein
MGFGGKAPRIKDLVITFRWVETLRPRLLPQRYPLRWRLGGRTAACMQQCETKKYGKCFQKNFPQTLQERDLIGSNDDPTSEVLRIDMAVLLMTVNK